MTNEKVRLGVDPIYDTKGLNAGQIIVLGFQHAVAMFGATVLVPILTGLSVTTTLLMAGLGTLLFHLLTKGKVPAFLGSSFAFIAGYNIVTGGGPFSDTFMPENLPKACSGVFVAGLIYMVLAGIIKLVGVKRVMTWFPPVVTGPIIICIGLILAPTALGNIEGQVAVGDKLVPVGLNWLVAVLAIAAIIICNIWGKGMIKVIPILIGVIVGYLVALACGMVDFSGFSTVQKVVAVPISKQQFMQFDGSAIITIAPIALATMMEHVGDISAISATVGKNYMSDPGLHRTLMGDGLATSLASIFGGPANTTYGENTGVLALTRVYAPGVVRVAAIIAVIASLFPAVGTFILTIPAPAIGGVSFVLYGMISAIGVRNMVENHVDLTKARNLMITSVILVSALGISLSGTGGIQIGSVMLSGLAVSALLGIILNAILPGKDYVFKDHDAEPVAELPLKD